jgi:hypothetical protein
MAATAVEEEVLEVASRARVLGAVKGQGSPQVGGARPADAGDFVDLIEVEQPAEVGLGDGLLTRSSGATEAKSRRVRATGVTGRRLRITRSMRVARWTRTLLSDRRCRGLVTWMVSGTQGMRPWLNAAPGPRRGSRRAAVPRGGSRWATA